MSAAWIFAIAVAIFSTGLLTAMFVVSRRERKAWATKMEAIERDYTMKLCESGARIARYRMRFRRIKRILDRALRAMPPDGTSGPGKVE
jgi:hypothetical protein